MSNTKKQPVVPYKTLGARLRQARRKRLESLAEVSGAVEIDPKSLSRIERGHSRPKEDILLLLISYFGIDNLEASKLWELAGYNLPGVSGKDIKDSRTHNVLVLPDDVQIAYTDVSHILVNESGVMLNFLQSVGIGGHMLAIARVGMSHQNAENLLKLLQKSLRAHNLSSKKSTSPKRKKNSSADKD